MSTPGKTSPKEQRELEERKIAVGKWVRYDAGNVSREGFVTEILDETETAHAPKVVYSCTNDKGEETLYTNNPSKLTVIPKPKGHH